MRKIFLLSFLMLPLFVAAQEEEMYFKAKGPVKNIIISTENNNDAFSLFYGMSFNDIFKESYKFDKAGREIYYINSINTMEYDTIIYDGISKIHIHYSEEHPNGQLKLVEHLDSLGNSVAILRFKSDTIYDMDSIVYNQFGKPTIIYSSNETPFSLYMKEAYKYDSLGREIGLRQFSADRHIIGGYNLIYKEGKKKQMIKIYVDEKGNEQKAKEIYTYDKDNNLIKQQSPIGTITYKDFDKYGNWKSMLNTIKEEGITCTTSVTREITYYED